MTPDETESGPTRPHQPAHPDASTASGRRRVAIGRLDHVHLRVPDRDEAARWYAEHLGFEPVEQFAFWAEGFEGGPLQISADGGHTTLALFEASEGHPMVANQTGTAFTVDADAFMAFARSLPDGIPGFGHDDDGPGELEADDIIDFDLCWAFEFADPWGNRFELNCYDYDRVRNDLVTADGLDPKRRWPADLFPAWRPR